MHALDQPSHVYLLHSLARNSCIPDPLIFQEGPWEILVYVSQSASSHVHDWWGRRQVGRAQADEATDDTADGFVLHGSPCERQHR